MPQGGPAALTLAQHAEAPARRQELYDDRPKLSPEDIKKLEQAQRNNKVSE